MKRFLSIFVVVGLLATTGASLSDSVSGPTLPGTGPASAENRDVQKGPTLPGT